MATFDEIQTQSYDYANDMVADFEELINTLQDAATEEVTITPVDASQALISENLLNQALDRLVDSRVGVIQTLPSFNNFEPLDRPDLTAVTDPTALNLPEFTLIEPVVAMPAAPSSVLPSDPGNAPELAQPALPARPSITLPDVPTFSPVAVPDVPALSLPSFTSELPVDDITAPTERFMWNETAYESVMLDELKSKLLADLQNGGYGIDTSDEEQIWERSRERDMRAAEAAMQEVARRAGAMGYMLPPGVLFAQQEAARADALAKSASASREVAIKRAELFVQNRQFTIQQVREVEGLLITYAGAVAERALNAARASVEMGIAIFNANVSRFNIRLQAYKAAAEVYEIRVRAALAVLEGYKTQIEAARLNAEQQKIHADIYKTQIDGVNALIGMYRTEMEAAKVQAEIERMKLENFKTSVEAYTARVGARTAEFDMYEAQIRGEKAKLEAFQVSVNAYNARVAGYAARSNAEKTVAEVQLAKNESLLAQYRSDLERYRTDVTKTSEEARAYLAAYENLVREYTAYSGAVGKGFDLAIEGQRANAQIVAETSRQQIQEAANRLQALLKTIDQRIGAATAGATVLGNTTTAALNAVMSIASKQE